MRMNDEELNTVITESKKQVFAWKKRAFLELKNGSVDPTLKAILNGTVRWWYNPVSAELEPMANEKLNDYPKMTPLTEFYGGTMYRLWMLVFTTNRGILLV